MKKKISYILGIVILATSLVGCGEKKEEVTTTQEVVTEESSDTGDTEATTETITEATTEEAKVEITVPEDGAETLLLFYVKDEYMNKWMNNWGVNNK